MSFTPKQADAIEIAERVTSGFSVFGASFIIITFFADARFRKPINRLVFYASWGNLFANAATMMGRTGVRLGISPACTWQAFFIQWLLPADALWTFAMACNVYLSFFHRYDTRQLKALEWRYAIMAYGVPFIPAFVYIFIHDDNGPLFGPATLWCWVTSAYYPLRIATFYGPVWVVIVVIILIYLRVGVIVFKWRQQIIHMEAEVPAQKLQSEKPSSPGLDIPYPAQSRRVDNASVRHPSTWQEDPATRPQTRGSGGRTEGQASMMSLDARSTDTRRPSPSVYRRGHMRSRSITRIINAKKATMNYCKCSLLFFVVLLVTWVPPSVNRLDNLIHRDHFSFPMFFAASLVLPLQGFWNMVIYIATSQNATKALAQDLLDKVRPYKYRTKEDHLRSGSKCSVAAALSSPLRWPWWKEKLNGPPSPILPRQGRSMAQPSVSVSSLKKHQRPSRAEVFASVVIRNDGSVTAQPSMQTASSPTRTASLDYPRSASRTPSRFDQSNLPLRSQSASFTNGLGLSSRPQSSHSTQARGHKPTFSRGHSHSRSLPSIALNQAGGQHHPPHRLTSSQVPQVPQLPPLPVIPNFSLGAIPPLTISPPTQTTTSNTRPPIHNRTRSLTHGFTHGQGQNQINIQSPDHVPGHNRNQGQGPALTSTRSHPPSHGHSRSVPTISLVGQQNHVQFLQQHPPHHQNHHLPAQPPLPRPSQHLQPHNSQSSSTGSTHSQSESRTQTWV